MKLLLIVFLLSCLVSLASCIENPCGGTFRGFQYTLTSPNYPDDYPTNVECIYRLQAEATAKCEQQFHLQFLDFNVKASEGCRDDYLQVGDNNFYCGNTLGLRKFTGKNNSLILTFHSDARDTAKGFKILVSALPCSLKLSPLKNPSSNIISSDSRSSWQALDTESSAYRRGIRGNNEATINNSVTRAMSNEIISSIRRPQISNLTPISNDEQERPRITSYLFLPPKENTANVTVHYELMGTASDDKRFSDVASPPRDLQPPRANSISSFSKDTGAMDKKIGVPSRNSGELGVLDYDLSQAAASSDCDKNAYGQLIPTSGSSDRMNYFEPQRAYSSSPNLVFDPKYGFGNSRYPPNTGYPSSNYPTDYPGDFGSANRPVIPAAISPNYPSGAYDPNYPNYPSLGNGYPNAGFIGPESGECCRVSSSSRFSIVSPGFPGGANQGYSCRYTIVKASPQVCRLRLNLRFFNFGADDPYCSLGYVDIDGQRLCGCRTGQNLQLLFTDNIAKTISLVSAASNAPSRLSGFLIDVVQETCFQPGFPQGSYPGYLRKRSVDEDAPIYSQLTRNKRDAGYYYPKPNVPFFNEGQTQERFFGGNCQSRLLFDWALASKEAFFKNARCPVNGFGGFGGRLARSSSLDQIEDSLDESACEEIDEIQGEIKSPLYPNAYPRNLTKCYRFNKAVNFCKLELYVQDFDLESSQECNNDYLSFDVRTKKYCGGSLNDFATVFDLTRTSSLRVDFVSDDRDTTGRGFDIFFSQLPCEPAPSS